MASLGPRIWLPNTENFFRELVDLIRTAEQSRTHCDSPDFYCRRLEEYERTLSVLINNKNYRIIHNGAVINQHYLHIILCTYLNILRNEFDVRDRSSIIGGGGGLVKMKYTILIFF